jgi:PadR family transcriptional regulator, regulatory protein AphA
MPRAASPLTLEYILLGLLNQQPVHGYNLYKQISGMQGVMQVWRVKQSQLYALLDKLEKDGYLQSSQFSNESRPPRKEYHITPAGQAAFLAWVGSTAPHPRDMRQEFLARLYFAMSESADSAAALIDKQTTACLSWLEHFQQQSGQLAAEKTYDRIVLRFRIIQTEALLRWLEECRQSL